MKERISGDANLLTERCLIEGKSKTENGGNDEISKVTCLVERAYARKRKMH